MRALSAIEAEHWCLDRGLRIDEFGKPCFTHDRERGFQVPIPKEPFSLPIFALQFLDAQVDEFDRLSGGQHLLWVGDWGIWSDLMTSMGENLFNHLRIGYGVSESIREKPAMVFSGSEINALIAFVLTPLMFGWDCYLIPDTATHMAFVSHDDWVGVLGKDEAVQAEKFAKLERFGARSAAS